MNQLQATAEKKQDNAWTIVAAVVTYLEAVKPRETTLLTAIGVATALITPAGRPSFSLIVAVFTSILLASAGVNGLTCYLDREWDARMERTRGRPLPSGRIQPAEKLLPFVFSLILFGLGVGFLIHPLVALAGLAGTITAAIARKTWVTHYFGIVSSLAPIWMGWLAVYQRVSWSIVCISIMVAIWVLIHVWSLMLAYRDDYLQAGLHIFPVDSSVETSVRWLAFLSTCLAASTILIYVVSRFGLLYSATAIILSAIAVAASLTLSCSKNRESAWRLYKFSAFPFLGLIFLAMALDRLLM